MARCGARADLPAVLGVRLAPGFWVAATKRRSCHVSLEMSQLEWPWKLVEGTGLMWQELVAGGVWLCINRERGRAQRGHGHPGSVRCVHRAVAGALMHDQRCFN